MILLERRNESGIPINEYSNQSDATPRKKEAAETNADESCQWSRRARAKPLINGGFGGAGVGSMRMGMLIGLSFGKTRASKRPSKRLGQRARTLAVARRVPSRAGRGARERVSGSAVPQPLQARGSLPPRRG